MAISITITMEDIARSWGMSVEEVNRRLAIINRGGQLDANGNEILPSTPVTDIEPTAFYDPLTPVVAPGRRYRFTAGTSKSGTCAICAQYVGMITDGSGTDGVPVPQFHNTCVCFLSPVEFDVLGTDADRAQTGRFEWLEGLTNLELADVLGTARADLIRQGIVTVRELYNEAGTLVVLEKLMLRASTGYMSVEQAAVVSGISNAGIKDLAKRGMISGARRINRNEWIIPAWWRR